MQPVTDMNPLQIPAQPLQRKENLLPVGTDSIPEQVGHLTSPETTCETPAVHSACRTLDVNVIALLMTLAGALILVLLYRVLLLRHRLRLAQARNALEYCSFFHTAQYTLKEPEFCHILPPALSLVTIPGSEQGPSTFDLQPAQVHPKAISVPSIQSAYHQSAQSKLSISSTVTLPSPPASSIPPSNEAIPRPVPIHPTLNPSLPPSHLLPPPPSTFSHPVINMTPPSPQPSWAGSSEMEVYSRIWGLRVSRIPSGSHSQVILFEHSSL
ncbi:uncharacterized protein LOC114786849 [Denticeps clupeoides]|uniref:uncharacterized protein LOC114786849 n=1 Tax=Denticeps clupeoides TaxID=299321 RepID=UPI0010A495E5|nr:uncharacterized protein LOC114786849 [Denticeps clupeoides]